MGDRLDQRQPVFGGADLAPEEGGEAICRTAGFAQMRAQAVKRALVVLDHLAQAEGQAGEGQLVAGQDEVIVARLRAGRRGSVAIHSASGSASGSVA